MFNIKDYRIHLELTQKQFADILGVGLSTYQNWERSNELTPHLKTFILLYTNLSRFNKMHVQSEQYKQDRVDILTATVPKK